MSDQLLWRPLAEENIRDPYSMYTTLRNEDPVHFAQTKEVIITRYDDVKAIFKDPRFLAGNSIQWVERGVSYLAQKGEDLSTIQEAVNTFLILLNPPEHTAIRNFVAKSWNDREVDEIIERNVQKTIASLGKDFDAISDFADPIPVYTICDILGIDTKEYYFLKELGTEMLRALELYPSLRHLIAVNEASKSFIAFFKDLISLKSQIPDDGLLSKMIERNKREHLLSERQLVSIAVFLFIAGEETTSALLGNCIHTLLTHPDQLKELQSNPGITEKAVEEILRFQSPVQLAGRIPGDDVELRGKKILKGSAVTLVIGAANRDEQIFENADRFNIHRKSNRHLAFGSGVHVCLGDWLARREAQLAIPALFRKYPDLNITKNTIEWSKRVGTRKPESLPLKVAL